jgi:hypothetical protein
VPKFGSGQYDGEDCRTRVTYKNASENASEAARLGEAVHISIFQPRLIYGRDGIIERVDANHAQILSETQLRQFHDHGFPAGCTTPMVR